MPREGRPPKPIELKERQGNPGKRALPKPLTVLGPAKASVVPKFTSGDEMLRYVFENGASAWIAPTDALASHTRDIYDAFLIAHARWLETGDKESFRQMRELDKSFRECLTDLCLNPSERSRLGLAVVKTQSRLAEMRERQAGLRGG